MNDWMKEEEEEAGDYPPEYHVIPTPNDFNVITIWKLIESDVISVPRFQRNYIWDIKKASKLIESLIIGLPVPQIFLYEKENNKFVVIDGQQRLLTIYYFIKGRFPILEKRAELRDYFSEEKKNKKGIPDEILGSDEYFEDFKLEFGVNDSETKNRLEEKKYMTLGEDLKTQFELRPIRVVIIKQIEPKDNSAMYEIFNRLNTGGANLRPQEIRESLYHSKFYEMLNRINSNKKWRQLTTKDLDPYMRDVEILLRGFAMLVEGRGYKKTTMTKFLNNFSRRAQIEFKEQDVTLLENIFLEFIKKCETLDDKAFFSNGVFNKSIYEAVFTVLCRGAWEGKNAELVKGTDNQRIKTLKDDSDFALACEKQTTNTKNVEMRLNRAEILLG